MVYGRPPIMAVLLLLLVLVYLGVPGLHPISGVGRHSFTSWSPSRDNSVLRAVQSHLGMLR